MAKIKVLIEGYAREEENYQIASSTTTLIKDENLNLIVDPGMDRELLLKALKKEKLSVNDIDYVILSHYHPDHFLLVGIFEKAKIIDKDSIYSFNGRIEEHNGIVPKTSIKIIPTPGHQDSHCSVLVNDDKLGKVVIAADVFWWWDNEQKKIDKDNLINRKDDYAQNEAELINSRKEILKIADYIIPGHGGMFKVKN
ncbi:MAG: MBL fold metallo-hydrolase [Nanoarchaeota archaeon]